MKILFTGGGTGGHIFPIIAIVREIRKAYPESDLRIFYLGPKDKFSEFLKSEGVKVRSVLAGKARRYQTFASVFQNFFDIFFKIPLGFIESFFYLFFLAPDLVFSKGGYGSVPVIVAARSLGIPIFLHESDMVPGFSNRILGRFSTEIFASFAKLSLFISFPKTEYFPLEKMILVGNPVRNLYEGGDKEKAKTLLNLSFEKPVILILGGSQGAQRINDKILEILPQIVESFEVIHQCGEKNFKQVRGESNVMLEEDKKKYYHLYPFLNEEEMRQAYFASEIVVSRGGSTTLFEIASCGKPSIIIPLPEAAQNHQLKNAYAYAENGSSLVIEESNFTARFFLEKLKEIYSSQTRMKKMQKAAKAFSRPRAAEVIASYIIHYLMT